jgi:hypothetical protein
MYGVDCDCLCPPLALVIKAYSAALIPSCGAARCAACKQLIIIAMAKGSSAMYTLGRIWITDILPRGRAYLAEW